QISPSNHIAIANLAKNLTCNTRVFPVLKDDAKATDSTLESDLTSCDSLVTTGGDSMGDFDFLKKEIKEYEIIIDKAEIKPGR
ncbi:molybdopterin-binding protein, partial [Campylobacter jejuni]|uniref:molybdopterin-binding protein n=1 Tax=Campylobacter jejuni TaxID=197 RepID=UPI00204300B4